MIASWSKTIQSVLACGPRVLFLPTKQSAGPIYSHDNATWKSSITGFGSRAGTTNCDASGLGGFVRRYLSTRNLRITSNFFRCTMYLASHSVLCHCLVKQHSRNDKKKKKKKIVKCQCTTKLTQVSSFTLIQWVTPESRSSAASNSGLIRIGTQPRTADAWHQWLMPAARRRHPRFFGHFWPSVWPSSRSNFDLGPSPLDSTEKNLSY